MGAIVAGRAACSHIGAGRPTYCEVMVVRHETRPGAGAPPSPPEFQEAVRRDAARPGCGRRSLCEEMPAPQRIAPYAAALSADVTVDGIDVGTGRLILLHDPAGNDAWDGTFRCVGLRPRRDRPRDDHRPAAGRRRLVLADRGARGARRDVRLGLRHGDPRRHRELRRDGRRRAAAPRSRSAPRGPRRWSTGTLDIEPHVEAWGELLCTAAGLPPVPGGRDRHAQSSWPARSRSLTMSSDPTTPPPARPTTTRRRRTPYRGGARAGAPGPAARPARRPAAAHRHPARPRRGLPRPRRRHRPGRHRRRARVGLPLLLARLPDPAAPRGRRHVPGRPDRLRLPRPAAGGPRRHRVDPARRHPGPRLPGRGRAGPVGALRHRARRAAPGLPAGRPGHPGRDPAGLLDEEGALRRRLVDPAAARSRGWSTPPSTSRCSSSCATCSPPSWWRPARTSGRARSSTRCAASRPATRVEPWRRTSGLHRVRGRRALGAVRELWETRDELAQERDVSPGRIIGDGAIVAAALAMPTTRAELLGTRASTGAAPSATPTAGSRPCERAATMPEDDLPVRAPRTRRPAHAARLGRARPRRGRAAHARPRRHHDALRGARPTGREPPHTRHRPARDVDAARRADAAAVAERLSSYGARAWQVELVTPLLVDAITAAEPDDEPTAVADEVADDADQLEG